MLDSTEQRELRECLWDVMSNDFRNQTKCLANKTLDRLNISEMKF
jgi:hypothetical protein